MSDPRRQHPIKIKWRGSIGRLHVGGEFWGAVEWSLKRNAWCIEDAEGRCLTHEASIHGQAEAREAAIALATAMIRDGRMPSPQEAAQKRRRAGDQVRTVGVSIMTIMSDPKFRLGVEDKRAGRPPRRERDLWTDTNDAWNYERGRLWATLAPRTMPLMIAGELNPVAVGFYARLGNDIP